VEDSTPVEATSSSAGGAMIRCLDLLRSGDTSQVTYREESTTLHTTDKWRFIKPLVWQLLHR